MQDKHFLNANGSTSPNRNIVTARVALYIKVSTSPSREGGVVPSGVVGVVGVGVVGVTVMSISGWLC